MTLDLYSRRLVETSSFTRRGSNARVAAQARGRSTRYPALHSDLELRPCGVVFATSVLQDNRVPNDAWPSPQATVIYRLSCPRRRRAVPEQDVAALLALRPVTLKGYSSVGTIVDEPSSISLPRAFQHDGVVRDVANFLTRQVVEIPRSTGVVGVACLRPRSCS